MHPQGQIPAFNPPFPAKVPLWLALLLKRQRKARLVPPAWLSTDVLSRILDTELEESGEAFSPAPSLPPGRYLPSDDPEARLEFSPPFIPTNAEAGFLSYHKHISTDTEQALDETKLLPYHWMELAHLFLTHAADNIYNPDAVRRLVRDLKEARSAKIRRGTSVLDAGSGVKMNGVGAMEIAEARTFITGVVDGLRSAPYAGNLVSILTRHTGKLARRENKHEKKTQMKMTLEMRWAEIVTAMTEMRLMTMMHCRPSPTMPRMHYSWKTPIYDQTSICKLCIIYPIMQGRLYTVRAFRI